MWIYSFPVLCTLVVLSFLVTHWRRYKLASSGSAAVSKVAPGPPKLPLIGNLHQLMSPLPHHAITNLARKYGPHVMRLRLGGISAVIISSPAAAKEVLKTKEINFAQRPLFYVVEVAGLERSVFFSPYGDYWRQVRKICVLNLLSANCVQSMRSVREEEVWSAVESISLLSSTGGGVGNLNVSKKVHSMICSITARAAFGKECTNQADFLSWIDESISTVGNLDLPDLYPSLTFLRYCSPRKYIFLRLKKRIDRILDDIISEHKLRIRKSAMCNDSSEDKENILDMLLTLQESDNQLEIPVTDDCIKNVILDLYSGGAETAATALEWAISELIKNPKTMEKAQVEVRQAFKGKNKIQESDIDNNLHYLTAVIKETLRLHPPLPLQPREAREACEISGYTIPAKEKILINTYAISRDPNIWTEPDSFRPERFLDSPVDFKGTDFEFIPFGAGRRMCPGMFFATATIQLALVQLLYHFDWTLPDGMNPQDIDMSEVMGVLVKKRHDLHLVPTIYVPFAG